MIAYPMEILECIVHSRLHLVGPMRVVESSGVTESHQKQGWMEDNLKVELQQLCSRIIGSDLLLLSWYIMIPSLHLL